MKENPDDIIVGEDAALSASGDMNENELGISCSSAPGPAAGDDRKEKPEPDSEVHASSSCEDIWAAVASLAIRYMDCSCEGV